MNHQELLSGWTSAQLSSVSLTYLPLLPPEGEVVEGPLPLPLPEGPQLQAQEGHGTSGHPLTALSQHISLSIFSAQHLLSSFRVYQLQAFIQNLQKQGSTNSVSESYYICQDDWKIHLLFMNNLYHVSWCYFCPAGSFTVLVFIF